MSVFLLNDDFEMIADQMGVLPIPSLREDAWNQFVHFNGSVSDFFKARKQDKPHWFAAPAVESAEHKILFSVEEQNNYAREHGVEEVRKILAAENLKIGQTKPAPKEEITESTNPYSDAFVGTAEQKEAALSKLLRTQPTLAASLAKSQGKQVTGQLLRTVDQRVRAMVPKR
jgi:hypothetical protein